MSLVQRVTSIEGTDYEPPQLDSLFSYGPQTGYAPQQNGQQNGHQNGYQNGYQHGYGTLPQTASLRHVPSHQRSLRHVPSQQRSLRHVLSYDALANPEEPSQATNPSGGVTQYKITTWRRVAQVCFTVLSCWLASGILFGFAALKPVLIAQGIYREHCTAEELEDNVELCYKQDLRLNLFFAVASTTYNISTLPVGTVLDRYGPRVAALAGSVCLAIGTVLMAFAFYIPDFDGYLLGNVFLALGGTFIFVPSFAIANAFPKYSGTIVAAVTGAFDASAAVFLFYRLAYEHTGGTFTPHKFFTLYLVVPVLIFIGQLTLMNEDAYKTLPQLELKIEKVQDATQDVHDSDDEMSDGEVRRLRSQRREHRESKLEELDKLLGDAAERKHRVEKEEDRHVASGVWGALHGLSAAEQMLSPWFILIALLTLLQMLRMNFFVATVRAQYEHMLGSAVLGKKINDFFDVALPVGGIAATPVIAVLLDNASTATVLAILVATTTVIGIVGSLPFLWAGYLNVVLFCLVRPLYYSAMSDYAAKVFGFATFGRVYGAIIAMSGAINLTQPAIDAMDHDVFDDNPIPVNVVLAVLGFLIGTALVVYVRVQGNRVMVEHEKQEEEWRRNSMIPEEDESMFSEY